MYWRHLVATEDNLTVLTQLKVTRKCQKMPESSTFLAWARL